MRKSRTSPEVIERQMRASALLRQRLQGFTFREIGMMQTPPVTAQAVHKAFWKVMRSHPFDPARLQRRQLSRLRQLAALDGDAV